MRALVVIAMSSMFIACMQNPLTGTGAGENPSECKVDADCSYRDTDQDVCTGAICQSGKCTEKLIKNTPDCQCHTPEDCSYFEKKACNSIACEAHKCKKSVAPAGPAPTQKEGDCSRDLCDGTSEAVAKKEPDVEDLGDVSNPCVIKSCSATGQIEQVGAIDGTACGAEGSGSICFQGGCLACKPQNPTSCGAEGPSEPQNDTSTTPAAYPENKPFCGFSSGTDIDWYTFVAEDHDLSYDAFHFALWSTAPTLEVCVYVKCGSGSPGGACATKLPGPNGSMGCCWTGAPSAVRPTWDLDCTNTGEDGGTAYVSVRAPGGDTCEPYAIVGGY